MLIDRDILHGQTQKHLTDVGSGVLLHKSVAEPFRRLREAATSAGIDLQVMSGFRDFSRQCQIWNLKATGKRPLLDSQGSPLDFSKLSEEQIVESILRWSALPGASRHHWGTDFDVFDQNQKPKNEVRLVPQEAAKGGPFERFSHWLEDNLNRHGFFRPYAIDRGGVSPEWWHLSNTALSTQFLNELSIESLRTLIEKSDLQLKEIVLTQLPTIFTRYVQNITPP